MEATKENNTKFRTKENYQYIVGMSFRFLLVASYQYMIRSILIFWSRCPLGKLPASNEHIIYSFVPTLCSIHCNKNKSPKVFWLTERLTWFLIFYMLVYRNIFLMFHGPFSFLQGEILGPHLMPLGFLSQCVWPVLRHMFQDRWLPLACCKYSPDTVTKFLWRHGSRTVEDIAKISFSLSVLWDGINSWLQCM